MPAQLPLPLARRTFLAGSGVSLGSMALSSLLAGSVQSSTSDTRSRGEIRELHHPAKIKRVIWLYMSGGPSHLETFDFKPELVRQSGEPMPKSFTKGQPIAQLQGKAQLKCLGPLFDFAKHGKSGQQVSSALPHIAGIADDICIDRPEHGDRGDQPRPGSHVHEHGDDDQREAQHGLVADVWPGERGRRPAGLRRAHQLRRPQPATDQQPHVA